MLDLHETADDLEAAVKMALAQLEQEGLSAEDADEFIKDSVFKAWWDWVYEPAVAASQEKRP